MTVHFIGAGPGAADLITVRGRELLGRCPVCLYAGSLVSPDLLVHCPPGARIVDTAPMTLDQIEAEFVNAHEAALDVARLHSGDLSVYSALAEQLRRLERRAIPYTLTPGVPAFAAASAALGRELTVPEVAQSVVLTRMPGRASRMPENSNTKMESFSGATETGASGDHRRRLRDRPTTGPRARAPAGVASLLAIAIDREQLERTPSKRRRCGEATRSRRPCFAPSLTTCARR